MEVKSINTDLSKLQDWCLVEFDLYTGKLNSICEKGNSTENLINFCNQNWEDLLGDNKTAFGIIEMSHDDVAGITGAKEKAGGNYYIKTPFLGIAEKPTNYESIFTSAELRCDYTSQFYRDGECWPVVNRITVSRNDTIEICIKSEQSLTGTFTYHFNAKSEGIEIADGVAGSLVDGELIKQIDLNQVNFFHYQDVELKIKHPEFGNSYLHFKVI